MSFGWAQIPEAIMEAMLQQVVLADYIRFGAVCVSWRSITLKRNTNPRMQLPWLMVKDSPKADHVRFFSPSEDRYYNLKLPKAAYCWGAYEGWLMIESQKNCRKRNFLYNPMTGERVRIPPFSTLPFSVQNQRSQIHEAILFSFPVVLNTLVVVCLYDEGKLALCTPGGREWYAFGDEVIRYVSIMFLNGYLYALDKESYLWSTSLDTSNLQGLEFTRASTSVPPSFSLQEFRTSRVTPYLAEKDREVLMVTKMWIAQEEEVVPRVIRRKVNEFKVFELDDLDNSWKSLSNIDEYMMVLGYGHGKSFSANNTSGAIANTIYFTEEIFNSSVTTTTGVLPRSPYHYCLLSVYNYGDSHISTYFPGPIENQCHFHIPPKWFSPDAWHRVLEPSRNSSIVSDAVENLCCPPGCSC